MAIDNVERYNGFSPQVSPTKRWESGLTSPRKKLMARLGQRLRRWTTTRASRPLLFYDDSFDATRRDYWLERDVWCRHFWYIIIFAEYSCVPMLFTFAKLGVDSARFLSFATHRLDTVSSFERSQKRSLW